MSFKFLILTEKIQDYVSGDSYIDRLPEMLRKTIPGIHVDMCHYVKDAEKLIGDVDAAFGHIGPELFQSAGNLKWLASPQAGPAAGYYHTDLIESDVVVTNMREIYNDHISAHIMAFILAFARGLHIYLPQQLDRKWISGYRAIHLPEATAVVVGVGGIGGEAARLCSEFGMKVLGVDARRSELPVGVAELYRPEHLNDVLPLGDFIIITVPETPETQGMFAAGQFRMMKRSAFLINIGRGATVVLDDLADALENSELSGAGLDVFQVEPLPPHHPLWGAPGVLITPHVAGVGPYLDDRRTELIIDNCVRFNEGRSLRNVVDKTRWF